MNRFGLFRSQQTYFAIPLARLRKILQGQKVFWLPRLPDAVSGVLVDAGEIIPVVDLVKVISDTASAAPQFLVLVEAECGCLAIPVDVNCGIVAEYKGSVVAPAEDSTNWLTGQFLFQDNNYQIIDIDFLTSVLT